MEREAAIVAGFGLAIESLANRFRESAAAAFAALDDIGSQITKVVTMLGATLRTIATFIARVGRAALAPPIRHTVPLPKPLYVVPPLAPETFAPPTVRLLRNAVQPHAPSRVALSH